MARRTLVLVLALLGSLALAPAAFAQDPPAGSYDSFEEFCADQPEETECGGPGDTGDPSASPGGEDPSPPASDPGGDDGSSPTADDQDDAPAPAAGIDSGAGGTASSSATQSLALGAGALLILGACGVVLLRRRTVDQG